MDSVEGVKGETLWPAGESGQQSLRARQPATGAWWSGVAIRYRLPTLVVVHAVLFTLALFCAFLLAYNFRWSVRRPEGVYFWASDLFVPLAALAVPIKVLVFFWAKQYRSSWRYVGLRDLFEVVGTSLVASFAFLTIYFLLENIWESAFGARLIDQDPVPRLRQSSVFLSDWAATIVFVCAAKVLVRFYYEELQPQRAGKPTRVLIVGAGDAGEGVLRELPRMRTERYACVGFLDDQVPELFGRIHNVEILGRTSQIREVCLAQDVQEVLIALPSATPKTIRALVERCEGAGVRFRTVPALADLIEGRVQVNRIRDVDIDDLLGREPVELDTHAIGRSLRDRRVLVTGAGGSIGSEMCRQIAGFEPERLILIEQAENSLFEIERELRKAHPGLRIVPYVGDIVDPARVEEVFSKERPSVVFHAAAHKHVPLMEQNPGEAVKNNVVGTMTIAETCLRFGVDRMVLISTDKAVNPTSVMGCSKRIAELFVQSLTGRGDTHFVTVRFGNVLGSSGSVVPIFKQQIAEGGPVTVTHPEMQRYFMTIPEAAQLVLQAGTMGKGGEIFMLHMGEPVRILDLARDMITLSGLRPGVDIDIVFTGKRAGEKLFEELSAKGEHIGDTGHPKIGIWKHRNEDGEPLREGIQRLIRAAQSHDAALLQSEMKSLVPEYAPESAAPCGTAL